MKEQMYSADRDGVKVLVWVRGSRMARSRDLGSRDPWRDQGHEKTREFSDYIDEDYDPDRFTDLQLVWERDV